MAQYKDFISENIAPLGALRIGIYDSNGNRVGQIPLGSLTPPNDKKKLYSFGALSDVHIGVSTATDDFTEALTFLSKETNFICISGDLVQYGGNSNQKTEYKNLVDTVATVPVYASGGNHDAYDSNIEAVISSYTGHPLYYSLGIDNEGECVDSDASQEPKAYGNNVKDVFIFVGLNTDSGGLLFTTAEMQWLYETLEANRNKRCFVFQHVRPDDACGNALGIYEYDIWGGRDQRFFESLLSHYKNIIFFHGHSHLKFDLQKYSDLANIDKVFGCWSVHIPSISVPRSTDSVVNPSRVELYAESEGYVVDVYENGIHLRGRDFVKGEFLPIASYWLDTTLQTIPANTFTDSTGTITT